MDRDRQAAARAHQQAGGAALRPTARPWPGLLLPLRPARRATRLALPRTPGPGGEFCCRRCGLMRAAQVRGRWIKTKKSAGKKATKPKKTIQKAAKKLPAKKPPAKKPPAKKPPAKKKK